MKKILLCITLSFCCIITCSCSKKKEYVDCEEIIKGAIKQIDDFPEYMIMAEMSDPNWEQQYENMYFIKPDYVEDIYVVHASTDGRTMETELAAIRYSSDDEAKKVITALEKRKQIRSKDAKNFFDDRDYLDEIVEMVDNTIITQNNEYVFYICCDNSEKAEKYCKKQIEGS